MLCDQGIVTMVNPRDDKHHDAVKRSLVFVEKAQATFTECLVKSVLANRMQPPPVSAITAMICFGSILLCMRTRSFAAQVADPSI